MAARVHGRLLAREAGDIVGVSGTTIGQWARHGYIRPSQSAELPHVYSVEDVGEAAIVAALLHRGVRHADVRRAIERRFAERHAEWWPYLYDHWLHDAVAPLERALITAGGIEATGFRYVGVLA